MVQLLLLSLISSLIITAIYCLFWDGMLFGGLRVDIEKHVNEYVLKPIWGCNICMSSVWGTILWFYLRFAFDLHLPNKQYLPFIFITCGINVIISGIIYLAYERNTTQI